MGGRLVSAPPDPQLLPLPHLFWVEIAEHDLDAVLEP
jgi:hypothetical protein